MVLLFKSHIISFLEYRAAAFPHASSSVLAPRGNVLDRFLRDVGLSRKDALLRFSLAPLSSRRDIAVLGLIHRSALGLGPRMLQRFFSAASSPARWATFGAIYRHHEAQANE